MSSSFAWAFWVSFTFTFLAWVSGFAYGLAYAWGEFDRRREARWVVVAEGEFDSMTHGVRQFVRLRDGQRFLLILDHKELDLERGERVRVRLGHCKRHCVERVADAA